MYTEYTGFIQGLVSGAVGYISGSFGLALEPASLGPAREAFLERSLVYVADRYIFLATGRVPAYTRD